jgi:UDPglucose 6-dehydrogenase
MKVTIVGYGFVGKFMKELFPAAVIYDPNQPDISVTKEEINKADVAFIGVPTNMLPDGSCDTSIVESCLEWLETPLIVIRSTIKPGTTDSLAKKYPDKHIVFQPEYIGETSNHPMKTGALSEKTFLIFGGSKQDCAKAVEVYQKVYNASVRIMCVSALEAELIKYMENTAIGTMVTLVNEFYNICKAFGVEYDMVREGFLMDPRMSRYFTFVFPDARGFGGKCLPKDINAITKASADVGYKAEFLEAILKNNDRFNKQSNHD